MGLCLLLAWFRRSLGRLKHSFERECQFHFVAERVQFLVHAELGPLDVKTADEPDARLAFESFGSAKLQ